MVHAVAFAALLTRALFRASRGGKVVKKVGTVTKVLRGEQRATKLRHLKRELEMGLNRREEAAHIKQHGTAEPLFPARIREGDVPADFETKVGCRICGLFVFKPSEWHELWDWVGAKMRQCDGDNSKPEGRDGYWLLQVGRARWEDNTIRTKAVETSAKHVAEWVALGMWE